MTAKRGQTVSLSTVVYITLAVLVLLTVILLMKGKMKTVKSDLDKRADEFKGVCEIAGSGRMCKPQGSCERTGGLSLGSGWKDCTGGNSECCQY
ncbi:hypothetical protein D6764_05835 [Candidatus Woesearchaeota archaeon]|nr:MAG: hypothetical protein D6764_05835 [Candidatus Woesearchaeota archaeon]